jgi:tRNA(adenine34) deaminase
MQPPKIYLELMQDLIDWTAKNCPEEEVPISAIVLDENGKELSRCSNSRVLDNNPVGHAEILALTKAGATKKNWRLDNCTLVVTIEPCAMCAGAILQTRISRLVFGAYEPKTGAIRSTAEFLREANPPVEVIGGVLSDSASALVADWFSKNHR